MEFQSFRILNLILLYARVMEKIAGEGPLSKLRRMTHDLRHNRIHNFNLTQLYAIWPSSDRMRRLMRSSPVRQSNLT
jgi:hypothetical protein